MQVDRERLQASILLPTNNKQNTRFCLLSVVICVHLVSSRWRDAGVRRNLFIRREAEGIPFYSCRAFKDLPDLCHGFSTRCGRMSSQAENHFNLGDTTRDSLEQVRKNRRHFLSVLHLQDARLATLHQIHSNRVYIIKEISDQWNQPEGDALATRTAGIALAVQTADCLPVLVADPTTMAVAAVHCGWRGILSRILTETVLQMQRAFDSDPGKLLVAIGPGIRSCCFEVGREVKELFEQEYPGSPLTKIRNLQTDKHFLDLVKALNIQLDHAGIRPENRWDSGICTCCNTDEFFSYRAEGKSAGRMMAIIGIRPR